MEASFILSITSIVIPSELTLREYPVSIFVGIGLFFSFLLIVYAKLIKSDVYLSIFLSLGKVRNIRLDISGGKGIAKDSSLVLLLNYFVSTLIILFILFGLPILKTQYRIQYSIFIPLFLFFFPIVSMYSVSLLTGERKIFVEPMIMKIIGAQIIGLIYFVLSFIWVLNPFDQNILINIIIWSFIVESLWRIFKSILIVYLEGVSFYYIILYFCTLEILPMILAYYFIFSDFV